MISMLLESKGHHDDQCFTLWSLDAEGSIPARTENVSQINILVFSYSSTIFLIWYE